MMKIAVSTATILLLLGTSALAQEQGKKRDDTLDKAGEIASQPARDVGIEKTMHRDAGIKQSITESQLHEHQDPREADARESNSQANRLTHQHQ